MVLINGDPISLVLTAAVVGIGAGIGSAIGSALYKALLEEKVQKFLDKKHRKEALDRLTRRKTPEEIVNKILGKDEEK